MDTGKQSIANDLVLSKDDTLKVVLDKLRRAAKKSCKKCYGRGVLGIETTTVRLWPCKCVRFGKN